MTCVMVVDDNAMNRTVIRQLCRHLGLDCVPLGSGEAALEMLANPDTRCDVLLLDLRMPGWSGEETLAKVRELKGREGIPVVAYSAHTLGIDAPRLLSMGFNALLPKPISLDRFRQMLQGIGLA